MKRLLIVFLLLFVLGCRANESPLPHELFVLEGDIALEVVETAVVGTPIQILAGPVDAPDGVPAILTYSTSYGIHMLRTTFQDSHAWFELPPEMTIRSGHSIVTVTSGNANGTATINLLADKMVDPVTPLVGARSIIADGAHWAMAVVVPFDQYGNPPPDGTEIVFKSLHPGDDLRIYETEVEHLLSWIQVFSGTTAGRTTISAEIDDAFGPEGTLMEIPGWPEPFQISADPPTLPADGFQLMNLRSDTIVDRFGNVIPDGTMIEYQIIGPDGNIREYPTLVLDGIAEVSIQSARVPGVYQVRGTAFGMQTEPFEIEFLAGPALGNIDVDIFVDQMAGDLVVTAGPIIGSLNQFVADGTDVYFTFTDGNGNSWTEMGFAEAGYSELRVRLVKLERSDYEVDVSVGQGAGRAEFSIDVDDES